MADLTKSERAVIAYATSLALDDGADLVRAADALDGVSRFLPASRAEHALLAPIWRAARAVVDAYPGRLRRFDGLNPYAAAMRDLRFALQALACAQAAALRAEMEAMT